MTSGRQLAARFTPPPMEVSNTPDVFGPADLEAVAQALSSGRPFETADPAVAARFACAATATYLLPTAEEDAWARLGTCPAPDRARRTTVAALSCLSSVLCATPPARVKRLKPRKEGRDLADALHRASAHGGGLFATVPERGDPGPVGLAYWSLHPDRREAATILRVYESAVKLLVDLGTAGAAAVFGLDETPYRIEDELAGVLLRPAVYAFALHGDAETLTGVFASIGGFAMALDPDQEAPTLLYVHEGAADHLPADFPSRR